MWLARLKGSGLWVEKWLRHQRRDAYWEHGSICEDFSAVQCPVMAASGWADGYTNSVFRLLEKLDVPRQGLVGPWSHRYPHQGLPGPAIGFPEPEAASPLDWQTIEPPEHAWRVGHDMATETFSMHAVNDSGTIHLLPNDLRIRRRSVETFSVRAGEIDSARGETLYTRSFRREDWAVVTRTHTIMTSDAENFYLWARLAADEGDLRFYEHETEHTIPRDHV